MIYNVNKQKDVINSICSYCVSTRNVKRYLVYNYNENNNGVVNIVGLLNWIMAQWI